LSSTHIKNLRKNDFVSASFFGVWQTFDDFTVDSVIEYFKLISQCFFKILFTHGVIIIMRFLYVHIVGERTFTVNENSCG